MGVALSEQSGIALKRVWLSHHVVDKATQSKAIDQAAVEGLGGVVRGCYHFWWGNRYVRPFQLAQIVHVPLSCDGRWSL